MTGATPAPRKPRIAVMCGYMPFYEAHRPKNDRAERDAWGRKLADLFLPDGEVLYAGLVPDFETGHSIGRRFAAFQPDVIVVAPGMLGPAGFLWEALRDFPNVPVVVWATNHLDTLTSSYDSVDHLLSSVNVAVTMIANVLVRHGRSLKVIAGRWYEEETQRRARGIVRAAAVAGMVRRTRFGVLGGPSDGYMNVIADPAELAGLGPTLVRVSVEEWTDAYLSVADEDAAALANEVAQAYAVAGAEGQEFHESCRLAQALLAIVTRHDLDGGTFNSNLEYGQGNPDIGLVGGFANSYLTTIGYPFTDTGDTITPIAMFVGKKLAGDSSYSEINTIDFERNAFMCSNTGEGDFSNAADPKSVNIFPAGSFTGKPQKGCIVDYELREGPATIIGFSPVAMARGGFVLIAMAADVIGRPELDLHVPHTLVRPRNGSPAQVFERWAEAGATHHAGLSCADIGESVAVVGDLLGIETRIV